MCMGSFSGTGGCFQLKIRGMLAEALALCFLSLKRREMACVAYDGFC